MRTVTIRCPITWWERCKWLYEQDKNFVDMTNWSMVQIGQDYIYIGVEDEVATLYHLIWPA